MYRNPDPHSTQHGCNPLSLALIRQRYTPFGGAERFLDRAMTALQSRGVVVTLLARQWQGNAPDLAILPCNPFYLGRLWRDWGFSVCVRRRLARTPFQLVQSHERIAGCDLYRAGDGVHREWLAQRDRILGPLARVATRLSPYHRYLLAAERRMFQDPGLKGVICNSRLVQDQILHHFQTPIEKLHVIYSGIDGQRFHPRLQEQHRDPTRKRWNIPQQAFLVLFVGAGFRRKGLFTVLHALARLPDDAWLLVVGKDKEQQKATRKAAQLGLANRVRFTGGQTDVRPFYGAADLLALADDPPRLFAAYRAAFPVVTYDAISPWIDRVVSGDAGALLCKPPVALAMTRGTTRGVSKRIPVTDTDLSIRVAAARGLLNYLLRTDQLDAIDGYSLNLNYPSQVGTVDVGGREIPYGFSSGMYVKYAAAATPISILPPQEDIDAVGGGTDPGAWEERFEMVYQRAKDAPITMCAGVCPSIIHFGQYVHRRHGILPKKLWQMRVIAAASVPGIHTKYKPALRALYGPVDVVEMYIATEGTFGQQVDDRQLVVPNFDLYVYEVEVAGRMKMLHEMRPREYGSLVISTPVLPRYRIGDIVRAFDPPYFRCIGRERPGARLRYWLEGIANLDFGRA